MIMSKKNPFKGMGKVFSFTLKENMGSRMYKGVTVAVGCLLLILLVIVNVIAVKSVEPSPVKKAYVLDESKMVGVNIEEINKDDDTKNEFGNVEFENVDKGTDKKELIKRVNNSEEAAAGVYITRENDIISVTVYVSKDSEVSEDDGDSLGKAVADKLQEVKVFNSGLDAIKLQVLCTPIEVNEIQVGDEKSVEQMAINIIAPMVFSLFMYMMLLFYGQSISKCVVAEKSSKLMEYILTSTTPYSLIAGKILAMALSAIIQFVFWCACVVVGFIGGDRIAKMIDSDYNNVISIVLKTVKEESAGAFTWYAVVFAIIAFCVGFLFFSVVAGLVSSFAQKMDGLTQIMMVYQYLVIIGFFVTYFGSAFGNKTLLMVGNYLPICSPFTLPANILIGSLPMVKCALSFGILVITAFVLVIVTGKIYKAFVLFNGAKITPTVIKNAIIGEK